MNEHSFDDLVRLLDANEVVTEAHQHWFFRHSRYANYIDAHAEVNRWAYIGNIVICDPDLTTLRNDDKPYLIIVDTKERNQMEYLANGYS